MTTHDALPPSVRVTRMWRTDLYFDRADADAERRNAHVIRDGRGDWRVRCTHHPLCPDGWKRFREHAAHFRTRKSAIAYAVTFVNGGTE